MRRLIALCLLLALAPCAFAQQRKLKLDVLGMPPLPGARTIGSIRLPLSDILKPEPGQTPTGPKLTDLAILTYRSPKTTSRDSLAAFYRKHAPDRGWRLLDEIFEGATSRSLVFHSKSAPGYLTVDIGDGPDNTIQIDLTRLLGAVDPARQGEVYKLTGKRIRFQRVSITVAGRFLDLKSNKLVQATLPLVESTSEAGLGVEAAKRLAPMDETYAVAIVVKDTMAQMSKVEVFTGNNSKLAAAELPHMGGSVTLTGRLRATQGLNLRVVISGPDPVISASTPAAAPARPAVASTVKPAVKPTAKTPSARTPAKAAPKPPAKPVKPSLPSGAKPLPPGSPIVSLAEWTLRPAVTALPEARRASSTVTTESVTLAQDVDLGSTCEGPVSVELPWRTKTTEQFDFSADFFGNGLARTPTGERTGVVNIQFPIRSGIANSYTLTQNVTTTITVVDLGYTYQAQWVKLPSGKKNPYQTTYTVVAQSQPTASKKTTGSCYAPPKPVVPPNGATSPVVTPPPGA